MSEHTLQDIPLFESLVDGFVPATNRASNVVALVACGRHNVVRFTTTTLVCCHLFPADNMNFIARPKISMSGHFPHGKGP